MAAPQRAEIIACETCGKADVDAAGRTRGQRLLAELQQGLALHPDASLGVGAVRCLWACERSCAVALRSPCRAGYVIAGLEPTEISARALLDFAALYARSEEGAVPYKQWPAALKGHFLCRFPRSLDSAPDDGFASDNPELGPQDSP
jgi:predicted metal-binding protein